MQGLQRAQQLLNVIAQQFPSIAQASETQGVILEQFLHGVLSRSSVPLDAGSFQIVSALATMIGPPTEPPRISKEGISLPTPDSA